MSRVNLCFDRWWIWLTNQQIFEILMRAIFSYQFIHNIVYIFICGLRGHFINQATILYVWPLSNHNNVNQCRQHSIQHIVRQCKQASYVITHSRHDFSMMERIVVDMLNSLLSLSVFERGNLRVIELLLLYRYCVVFMSLDSALYSCTVICGYSRSDRSCMFVWFFFCFSVVWP